MRVAAIGDLHCRVDTPHLIEQLLGGVEDQADVLAIAGDLTDTGLPDQAIVLTEQLSRLKLPILATLGNHDHESGKPEEVARIIREGGVRLLDGSGVEIDGIGFAGTKGFSGGFGETLVMPFGEAELKTFILTGINEAIRLEKALIELKDSQPPDGDPALFAHPRDADRRIPRDFCLFRDFPAGGCPGYEPRGCDCPRACASWVAIREDPGEYPGLQRQPVRAEPV